MCDPIVFLLLTFVDHQLYAFPFLNLLKNSSSLSSLISCCPEILNSTWLSWYLLLKIACLHVSFTAYENFYKLSKMHCLLIWFSTFQPSEVSEKQRSNNQTYIHLYTDLIIHKYICDRSLSGNPFHILIPFLNAKGLCKCDSTHYPN